MVDISDIVSTLQGQKGGWRQLSVASGVPYSTLSKIARGKIPNPGLGTINKLLPFLETAKRAAAAERA